MSAPEYDRIGRGYALSRRSVLDPGVRAATSAFARLDDAVEAELVERLRGDLESGAWDERYGHYRRLLELDIGLRLLRTDA